MNDPWKDIRDDLDAATDVGFLRGEDLVKLLADADALLAVVRAAEKADIQGDGTYAVYEAMDSLPQHLKGTGGE